ncbi:hypothetical protein J6590_031713 [Homalodisca vitripennis]|nr:hypothetical protein J6590_031713 [Homalodisca vitripennis]
MNIPAVLHLPLEPLTRFQHCLPAHDLTGHVGQADRDNEPAALHRLIFARNIVSPQEPQRIARLPLHPNAHTPTHSEARSTCCPCADDSHNRP